MSRLSASLAGSRRRSRRQNERTGRYWATLRARVNGRDLSGTGRGTISKESGIVEGVYGFNRLPKEFSPLILDAVMVTGYPSVCRHDAQLHNPFELGSYRYVRSVDFGRLGGLEYTTECTERLDEDGAVELHSEFELGGEIDVPSLARCEPLVETWIPGGAGRVNGLFNIVWLAEDGRFVSAVAKTDYELPAGRVAANVLHRWISLSNPESSRTRLEIHQESHLLNAALPLPSGA